MVQCPDRIIASMDTGVDDALALAYLLGSADECELGGVIAGYGKGAHEGSGLGYKAFLHNDGSLIRCLSIVLWDCFERKSAENDMEGLDFRSTSAPDIPYESSGKPVCHTLVKLFHYRDRVGDLMRSRLVQSVLAAGSCL